MGKFVVAAFLFLKSDRAYLLYAAYLLVGEHDLVLSLEIGLLVYNSFEVLINTNTSSIRVVYQYFRSWFTDVNMVRLPARAVHPHRLPLELYIHLNRQKD